jgi:type II secretion system protein N
MTSRLAATSSRRPSGRRRRTGWTVLVLSGLVAILFLAVPRGRITAELEQALSRRTGLQVRLEEPSLRLPAALHFKRAILRGGRPPWDELQFEQVRVAPYWRSLFSSDPGLRVDARYQDGRLRGYLLRSGGGEIRAVDLSLSSLVPASTGLGLDGILSEGRYRGPLSSGAATAHSSRNLELAVTDASLTGLQGLGLSRGLPLGEILLAAEGLGPELRLTQLTLSGGALQGEGSGSLQLTRPWLDGRLDLLLSLQPTPVLPPPLRQLLARLFPPAPDGRFYLSLTGSPANPRLRKVRSGPVDNRPASD